MRYLRLAAALVSAAVGLAAASDPTWTVKTVRVTTPPVIDGKLEELWFQTEPARLEREYRPAFGVAAQAPTEVYVLYDDEALYFAWVCHESQPRDLVACATVRDMFLNYDDALDVMLDPKNDDQSCYDLMVNYRGVKYDGALAQDGAVGGPEWNGYWEAKTSVGEDAWYCEMAVPWSTMRYDRNATYMGVQFLRFRKPVYEETFWASDGSFLNRVATFGRITGFENLPPPRPLEITPYVTARAEDRTPTPAFDYTPTDGWEFEPRYGGDVAYRPGAALSANATILPDYAYIEADPAQITLEPTETYLDERRPFFTEGFEFFDNDYLYTRRFTEIAGGAKVTGRVGRVNYGAFDVKLKGDDPRFPQDNFGLARLSYDFPNGTTFGVGGMGRRGFGETLGPEDQYYGGDDARYNNVAMANARVNFPARITAGVNGYKSQSQGEGGDGYDYSVGLSHPGITDEVDAWYGERNEDFRADMSFLQPYEMDTRYAGTYGHYEFQLNRAGLRFVRPGCYYEHYWNLRGETKYNAVNPALTVSSENDFFVSGDFIGHRDLRYVPLGYPEYRNARYDITVGHHPAPWGRAQVGYWRGMWYGGWYHDYSAEFDLIPAPALVFTGNVEVGNPRGGERFYVGNLKTTYNFTEYLFGRLIVQGETATDTAAASVLGGWEFHPGSIAYLAYEQRRDGNAHFGLAEQLAFLKLSYMLRA